MGRQIGVSRPQSNARPAVSETSMLGSSAAAAVLVRAAFLILGLLLMGCTTTRSSHERNNVGSAQFRDYIFHPSPTPPTPLRRPSYLAKDLGRLGQPTITQRQAALIRRTLSLVKPCQADMLRYAFPSNAGTDFPFVLFFQGAFPFEATHALWTHNMFYNPRTGEIFPMSGDFTDAENAQWDIKHTGCNGKPI